MEKRLCRSRTDKMISGVCGGIAEYFAIDPTIVRLATVALLFVTSGAVLLVYIVMAVVVPEAPAEGESHSPRAMTGEEISAGAQGFARDVQTAASKVVGGATPATAATAAATPTDETATQPQPDGTARPGSRGAVLIGILLIAFGLLMFAQWTMGFDLLSVSWKLVVPSVIILLGVLILIRSVRNR